MTDTVGQKLQKARQARSLSLEQAAHATHIRLHYLKALEEGDLRVLPSPAQVRGFLRAYAGFLGLDAQELLEDLGNEFPALSSVAPTLPSRDGQKSDLVSTQAEAIFAEIGETLRQHRELLGLSLEDAERHTHLRTHYLEALEAGNLRGLPSPVQGRGMLNNYAQFLGLDPEPLLLRFAEGLQARLVAQRARLPQAKPKAARPAASRAPASPLRRFLSGEFLFAGAVILFLAGFVLWGTWRVNAMRSQAARATATPTARSIADVLLSSPTGAPSPSPAAREPAHTSTLPAGLAGEPASPAPPETAGATQTITGTLSAPPFPAQGDAPIQVHLLVRQRAWMRVTVDDRVEFTGRVTPGSAYTYQGRERVEILASNGAALQIYYNQTDLGILGSFGEVVMRIFTLEGVQTPTATLTFTPLPTTPATPTPAGAATPAPASTPTPTP